MEVSDVDHVMEVERASFTTPWTTDIFYQELLDNKHAHYFVLQLDEQIIGYIGTWIVIDDAQITNIAIMPGFRGHKLGEKLFWVYRSICIAIRCKTIIIRSKTIQYSSPTSISEVWTCARWDSQKLLYR